MRPSVVLPLVAVTALLGACKGKPQDTTDSGPPPEPTFPEDFLWGTSTAGFQVEPGCPTLAPEDCEDRRSDWYQWVTDPGLLADDAVHLSDEPLSDGPGFYELYAEDLARAADELHTGAFRLSLEWSRLFPDEAAEAATTVDELARHADPEAAAFYHAVLAATRAEGLVPMVTLIHYTLPVWLHDGVACHADLATCADRGWLDRDRMLAASALYAGFAAREYGDDVDLWLTLNEPLVAVLSGYVQPGDDRYSPPGVVDTEAALEAAFNMARGHTAMYDALVAGDGADADGDGNAVQVGFADHLVAVRPYDEHEDRDLRAVEHADQLYNRAFIDAAGFGCFDTDLDGACEEDTGRQTLDFLGVNYYNKLTVQGLESGLFGYELLDFVPLEIGTDFPEGFPEVLAIGQSYGLPVYVTENGTASHEPTAWDTFLRPHLQGLLDAIGQGVDLRGYFYWSLMDNYEWNHGMTEYRFGLYEVDVATKARTLRDLGARYAEVAAANAIPEEQP